MTKTRNFIYDDTSDLHRALAYSDGYYGDYSSVKALYSKTGKPSLLQSINLYSNAKNCNPSPAFACLCMNGDFLYFIDEENNCLYRYNESSESTEFIVSLPVKPMWGIKYYKEILVIDTKIVLVPCGSDSILIYDECTCKFSNIKLNINAVDDRVLNTAHYKFSSAYFYKQWIYFVPYYFPAIVRLNIETLEVEYLDAWLFDIERKLNTHLSPIITASCSAGNRIVMSVYGTSSIVELNLDDCQHRIIDFSKYTMPWCTIAFDGKYCYLHSHDLTVLVKLNLESKDTKEFAYSYRGASRIDHLFSFSRIIGEELWLFPYNASVIVIFDMIQEKFQFLHERVNANPYTYVSNSDKYIYATRFGYTNVESIEQKTKHTILLDNLMIDENPHPPQNVDGERCANYEVHRRAEQAEHRASDFAGFLDELTNGANREKVEPANAGQAIYSHIKKLL